MAEDDGAIVGCAWVLHHKQSAYLDYLAIVPACQHRGVGVRLVAKVREILRRRKVKYVRCCMHLANTEVIKIAQAFGCVIHAPYTMGFVNIEAE